jgi:6-pyruvoyltetrahydropterin/6-carboxytetrahydropterin synthase
MDLGRLRDIVHREIIEHVDHRNLNVDVEFMRGVIPTTENLAVSFWRVLAPAVAPARLERIRIRESENNVVEYSGE